MIFIKCFASFTFREEINTDMRWRYSWSPCWWAIASSRVVGGDLVSSCDGVQFQLILSILEKCYPSFRYNQPDIRQYLHVRGILLSDVIFMFWLTSSCSWKIGKLDRQHKNTKYKLEFCFLFSQTGPDRSHNLKVDIWFRIFLTHYVTRQVKSFKRFRNEPFVLTFPFH